ncbi:MAG: transcription termination/antitermination protein NusA [Candidatus Melainabacteria bacterium GWF2_37_15]|nr:MAG: transcription termination/antitermination protein NusA [Candidatus Melainabacteria bacterium GWF2_37_15]
MIKVGKALVEATDQMEKEKGIPKDAIMRLICDAMLTAYKKHLKEKNVLNIVAAVDEINGEVGVFRVKEVVEQVEDEHIQMSLEEAQEIDPNAEVGDEIQVDVTPSDFGRIAAQAAKQVITQRLREAERSLILEEFTSKKGTLVTGIVRRVEPRHAIVNIGKTDAILPKKEQIPREYYRINDRLRVYVLDVRETSKLPQVILSQIHPRIVQELFELEVPEIEDGIIEIKSIAREAGFRTKIAVASTDPNVDPVGACIGPRGGRIQTIVNELKNEKIDIIRYTDNPVEYITNALSPARIVSVQILDPDNRVAVVIVPDDQLSLAIGREGQNVRLAHRLTGWKIDIKSLSQYEKMEQEDQDYEEYVESQESEETAEQED